MSFTSKVSVWCINQANVLIHAVNHLSVPLLFSVALILTIIWIVGKKLSRFSKPENPKVSRIIRDVSSVLSPIAFAVIILFLIYSSVVLALVFFGYSQLEQLRGQTTSDVLIITINQLWNITQHVLIAILGGGFLGLGIAGYLNYYLIQDWERGEGLHDINQLVKAFTKFNGYNPMEYIDIRYRLTCQAFLTA